MIRQNIILGNYTYIADLFVAGEDNDYIPVHKKFVMIKNNNVLNDIVYDTEVYFIEKDIVDQCLNTDESIDTDKLGSLISFPILTSELTGYSSDYKVFNENFNEDSFKYGLDIYKIYDNKYEEAYVTCDRLRLYFPTTKPTLNAIVCATTYMSNVKFYFVCREVKHFKINSETEFTVGHTNYSEFVDVYIPNIDLLFKRNNLYAIENANINEVRQSFENELGNGSVSTNITIYPNTDKDSEVIKVHNTLKVNLVTTKEHNVEFTIYNSNDFNKTYKTDLRRFQINKEQLAYNLLTIKDIKHEILEANTEIKNNIVFETSDSAKTWFLTVTYVSEIEQQYELQSCEHQELLTEIQDSMPYHSFECVIGDIDDSTNLWYVIGGKKEELNITLSKYINDIDNIVELQTLVLPFSIEPVADPDDLSVKYKKVFVDNNKLIGDEHINASLTVVLYPFSEYDTFNKTYTLDEELDANSDTFTHDLTFRLGSSIEFNNETGATVVKSTFTYPKAKGSIWEAYCEHYNISGQNYLDWEPDEEDSEEYEIDTTIEQVGYRLEIATDNNFAHVVYAVDKSIEQTDMAYFIDDFEFNLSGIFETWDNIPELLVVRTMFIDKLLRNTFISNVVYLPKEKIKYLIKDEARHRALSLVDMQANPNEVKTIDSVMDLTKFNFIDKITCVVNKKDETQVVGSTNNSPKIVYKPIFYRVVPLASIKIKAGLNQNIGINLSDLMTKVESFKLIIGDTQYIETARNDIYVIFNINAADLTGTAGTYSITNQDDEYISSGTWQTY